MDLFKAGDLAARDFTGLLPLVGEVHDDHGPSRVGTGGRPAWPHFG